MPNMQLNNLSNYKDYFLPGNIILPEQSTCVPFSYNNNCKRASVYSLYKLYVRTWIKAIATSIRTYVLVCTVHIRNVTCT